MSKRYPSQRSTDIAPALGWTFLSRDALARAKAQMDEEAKGVRDEIGFLTLHQRYADRFFPGTSVLHTRARYALFVPWLFEELAGKTGLAARRALQERERVLAGRLRNKPGEDRPERRGTIGALKFPKPSNQPPSVVYWNALATWRILRPRADGRVTSRIAAHRQLDVRHSATDDDKQPLLEVDPPFVRLPPPPANWSEGEITFRMEPAEVEFLRDHLGQLRRPGSPELSLLARLVRTRAAPPDQMWDPVAIGVAESDAGPLTRARQAASLAAIGRGIYDALLERFVEDEDYREPSLRHRRHLEALVDEHGATAAAIDLAAVEADIGALPAKLHAVVAATRAWIAYADRDMGCLLGVYAEAEQRKGPRARLARTPNGRTRRSEWATDNHALAGPLHYRWDQVWRLLADLADLA